MLTLRVSSKKCFYTGLFILIQTLILCGFLVEPKARFFLGYDDGRVHGNTPRTCVDTRSVVNGQGFENNSVLDEEAVHIQEQAMRMREDGLRLKTRFEHAREKCEEYSELKNWTDMRIDGYAWGYKSKELAYCVTPKVGCTFWKSVIRFLNHDFKGVVNSPGDINRMEVHYGGLKHTRVYNLKNTVIRSLLSTGKSFMFTRDPYARLWSAYIDKYYLPDFWRSKAKGIINAVRPNATLLQKKCANDITFEEFLTFVVKVGKTGQPMEEHYTPVYRLCNPCLMKFDYIGKQETFADDSKYILHELGLDYIMENYTNDNRVAEEMKTLINYNFELERHITNGCFDIMEVASRIWKTFQMNGYLPNHVAFPSTRLLGAFRNRTNTRSAFTALVLSTYEKYKSDAAVWKKQRRAALVENFQKVSPSILQQLEQIYKPDFQLFSYDPRPDDIFNRVKE